MDLKKVYFTIVIGVTCYCGRLIAVTNLFSDNTSNIREYKINNLKQQNNIMLSNITREIITANKTTVQSSNRFALERNNCGANLYFKEGREKKTNYIWRNYCLDASVKYNIYNRQLLVSCTYNYLNSNIENNSNKIISYSQTMRNFAISQIDTYEYIDSICTIFVNSTKHASSNFKRRNTKMYGVAYTFYYSFEVDLFIAQLMLTTRYLYIDTLIDSIEVNNDDRLHLISVGPVITMQKGYRIIEKYSVTVGFESGYLRTINTNIDTYIRVAHSIVDKISNNVKAQNDWYFLGSVSLRHHNIIVGIEVTYDRDNYKNLYGASSYIKIKF
jgi:hypothetical protein